MSFELHGFKVTVEASADLSAAQFHAMTLTATGLALATAQGEHLIGILNDDPDALGVAGELVNSGISKWEAGAAVSIGDPVTTNDAGKVIAAATTNIVHGTAMEAAAGSGTIIAVLLNLNGHVLP